MGKKVKTTELVKSKIIKGDYVKVITGKCKGQTGKVTKVLKSVSKVLIEGVNLVKDFNKKQQDGSQAITEKSAPLHISNVAYFIKDANLTTKIGYQIQNGKKVRVARKNKNIIDAE